MAKVLKSPDCGNSPKNLLVESLAIAIETFNASAFARCVIDDVVWTLPGRKSLLGKAACLAYLKAQKSASPKVVRIRKAINHGRAAAADGVRTSERGHSNGFCHFVNFASLKGDRIASISSYYSDLGDEE